MNIGKITPVCQSIGVLPNFHATWHTRVNQRIPSPVSAFNISGLISSSPAAYPDFITLIAVPISAAVKTSSFPRCVILCVSRVDAFTGFKRSSKYSLHRERISFSSVRKLPAKFLVEYVTLDLLPRKRRMICQNTLFAEKELESNRRPTSSHDFSLDFFTSEAGAFRASGYGIANQMTICPVARS